MATIKKAMKAQKGKTVSPTYKNLPMGVKNENYQRTGVSKDVKPSSSDSARYRGGFEQGMKGSKGMKNEGQVEKMGRWEGQNAGKKKGKMGMTVKKAQTGKTIKQSNADMMKEIAAREKRIAARDSANQKKSYTNERANKVIGKNKMGGMTKKCMTGCK